MEFGWSWLSRTNKNREPDTSDEDKNPKHHKKSWSEMAGGSPREGEARDANTAPHVTSDVTPNSYDPKKTYTGEQVFAILAKKKITIQVSSLEEEEGTEGWTKYTSNNSTKREKMLWPRVSKKRKLSPSHRINGCPTEACWNCGIRDHYKENCHTIRCHYCKKVDHQIAECPAIPDRPLAMKWRKSDKPVRPDGRSKTDNMRFTIKPKVDHRLEGYYMSSHRSKQNRQYSFPARTPPRRKRRDWLRLWG